MMCKVTRAWPWHGVAAISPLVRSWLGAHQRRTGGSAAACSMAHGPCPSPMQSLWGGTCDTHPPARPVIHTQRAAVDSCGVPVTEWVTESFPSTEMCEHFSRNLLKEQQINGMKSAILCLFLRNVFNKQIRFETAVLAKTLLLSRAETILP